MRPGSLPMARFSSVRILVSPQCCQHYRFFGDPSSRKAFVSLRCGCGPVPSRMPRSRDRSTAGTGKLIRLSCSAIQRQPSYPFAAVEKPALILFFAHLTACLINLVVGWRAIRVDPRNVGARMLLAAALLGLGPTHQAAQRLDTTHVLFAAVVSLGLAPLSLFILLPQSSIGLAGRGRAVYALAATIAVVALAVPEVFGVSTNNCAAPFRRRKNRFSCCSVSAVFRSNRPDRLAPLAR